MPKKIALIISDVDNVLLCPVNDIAADDVVAIKKRVFEHPHASRVKQLINVAIDNNPNADQFIVASCTNRKDIMRQQFLPIVQQRLSEILNNRKPGTDVIFHERDAKDEREDKANFRVIYELIHRTALLNPDAEIDVTVCMGRNEHIRYTPCDYLADILFDGRMLPRKVNLRIKELTSYNAKMEDKPFVRNSNTSFISTGEGDADFGYLETDKYLDDDKNIAKNYSAISPDTTDFVQRGLKGAHRLSLAGFENNKMNYPMIEAFLKERATRNATLDKAQLTKDAANTLLAGTYISKYSPKLLPKAYRAQQIKLGFTITFMVVGLLLSSTILPLCIIAASIFVPKILDMIKNKDLIKVKITNEEYNGMKMARKAFRGSDPKPARDLNKPRKILLSENNVEKEFLVDRGWYKRYCLFHPDNSIASHQDRDVVKGCIDKSKEESREIVKNVLKRAGI